MEALLARGHTLRALTRDRRSLTWFCAASSRRRITWQW